jgi:diguanylate cyclase (GGDEF)-like protein
VNSGLFVLGSASETVSVHAATGRFTGIRAVSELELGIGAVVRTALGRLEPYAVDRRYVVVPLRTRDEDPGCMIIEGAELPAELTEACQLYARQVTQALENMRLYERATVDPLTRLFMRDFGLRRLDEAMRLAARTQLPTSVVLCDVDDFKLFNDRHGHAGGDLVLHAMGETLRSVCRSSDVASRHGGEEFLVVLPATDLPSAAVLAERMRAAVAGQRIGFEHVDLAITASFGVATLPASAEHSLATDAHTELVKRADRALYRAKAAGRDCVVCDHGQEISVAAA